MPPVLEPLPRKLRARPKIASSRLPLGEWAEDETGLPCYAYRGCLPWRAARPDGRPAHLHDDPYFLLGNHRFTLFAHVGGSYRLFTTQRGFALANLEQPGAGGAAGARLQIGRSARVELTGLRGLAADPARCHRTFGCGFAQWQWPSVGGVAVSRTLSVRPSAHPGEGAPAALLDVELRNTTGQPLTCCYTEWLVVRYATTFHLSRPGRERVLHYAVVTQATPDGLLLARVEARTSDLSLIEPRDQPCRYDLHPPAVLLGLPGEDATQRILRRRRVADHGEQLEAGIRCVLAPGETRSLRFVLGLVHTPELPTSRAAIAALTSAPRRTPAPGGVFGQEWLAQVPQLADEPDPVVRREMRWHAAMLLALVKYHEFHDGVYVPQSGAYDYLIGFSAAPRDFAQHLLPLCRLAPDLARSAILVQFRRMQPDGSWAWSEVGAGWQTDFQWTSSDFQLYAMLALAEYLDATRDYTIFAAPAGEAEHRAVPLLDRLTAAFRYLRDEVSTGSHGLVRLLGGDWNDSVCYDRPMGTIYWGAESALNAALALDVMRRLPRHLKEWAAANPGEPAARARRLAAGLRRFRLAQREALLRDWGDRPFPPRFHINENETVGRDALYLEPVGLLLRQPDIPLARRLRLLQETQRRLARGEPLGLRCREEIDRAPDAHFLPGCQENGGIWWALVGSTLWGAAATDRAWARRALLDNTLQAYARAYPDYWLGHWTAADCFNSATAAAPGLGYDQNDFARYAGFTSHVHAWLLFCHQTIQHPGRAGGR